MTSKGNGKTRNTLNLPLVAMRGVVVFPKTINHFDVGRGKSITAIETSMRNRTPVFLIAQRDIQTETPEKEDLFRYGVVAEVQQVLRFSDSYIKVIVDCKYRARLIELYDQNDYYSAEILRSDIRGIREADSFSIDAMARAIREQLGIYIEHVPKLSEDIILKALSNNEPETLADYLAFNLNIDFSDKQAILEAPSVIKRLKLMHDVLVRENQVLKIEKEINEKVQEALDNNQKEYYLREQIKAITNELGNGSGNVFSEADEFRSKIQAMPLEKEYIDKLLKEVDRLVSTPSNSSEAAVIHAYLDTVVELPWGIFTKDDFNIKRASTILNRDHYGLKKVKERMLEFLAVRALTNRMNGSIICLVGPPGVGKTSIATSIAEALGRKFVRMSLGGVNDESEIRGHRRTYVASMAGRIMSAISHAGSCNPLMLLDEIDKMTQNFRGDPASALLEVLDPEQNSTFKDHYLDVPFDLSQVLFITTANNPSEIPPALYDRMDVIELSSYTREEKFKIAKLHLIKKQLIKHGLAKNQFHITDGALYALIDQYTHEAGVRNLERQLASLMRKAAKQLVAGEAKALKVVNASLEPLLGPPIVHESIIARGPSIGIANGLAWTPVGGDVMPIETTVIHGTGKMEITGSLGDVMKESAKLAVTYVRTLPENYNIPDNLMSDYDIHIHVPEGAVPKDGPSAGVTLTVSLVSGLCGIPVKSDIAMTGEITLKGRVLAIGGLKEKLIAAYKEKLNNVIIPRDNMADLQEIPEEILGAMNIVPVDRVENVLQHALTYIPQMIKPIDPIAQPVAPEHLTI